MTKINERYSKKDGHGLPLFGMLLYPFDCCFGKLIKLEQSSQILGDI